MTDQKRCWLGALSALLFVLVFPGKLYAEEYPSRSLRLVVPFPPGGPSDAMGRLIAQYLGDRVGQTVVVDNRPGAGSVVGMEVVARAQPDGYTLGLATADSFSVLPAVRKTLPFDVNKDFTPVALMARLPNAFAVHPNVPVKTIPELVALAKAKPGSIRYGSPGLGTLPHFAVEMLRTRADIDIVHVPYKGGGPAVTDTIGGHIQMVTTGVVAVAPFVTSGQLRALAVTTEARSPMLPNVPTMIESGFPDFVAVPWFGVNAPARVPAAVLKRLSTELSAAAKQPEFQKRLSGFGGSPGQQPLLEAAFKRFQAAELARWREVVTAAKFKLEE